MSVPGRAGGLIALAVAAATGRCPLTSRTDEQACACATFDGDVALQAP